jgi:hypothetical protein
MTGLLNRKRFAGDSARKAVSVRNPVLCKARGLMFSGAPPEDVRAAAVLLNPESQHDQTSRRPPRL